MAKMNSREYTSQQENEEVFNLELAENMKIYRGVETNVFQNNQVVISFDKLKLNPTF